MKMKSEIFFYLPTCYFCWLWCVFLTVVVVVVVVDYEAGFVDPSG